jgi:hypothetical protein
VTGDPIGLYRAELRSAAARRASAFQRRRRRVVALGIALGAVLIVGGAVAAQTRWLDSGSQIKFRYTAAGRAAAFDYPLRGYAKCMAAHGARRVSVGFRIYRRNAVADSACKPFLDAFAATCRIPELPGERAVSLATAAECASVARRVAPAAR